MQKADRNGRPFETFEKITRTVVRIDNPTPGMSREAMSGFLPPEVTRKKS
jgi:hypothetical protein